MIEKVKRRLEGWHVKILSRGGSLVLLRSVLTAIPIFYLSVYKLPIGVGKRLEGLIRRFLWNKSGSEQGTGQALVSWEVVCRPTEDGELRIINIQKMNMALLTKWVARIMSSRDDLVTKVLKESCGTGLT